MAGGRSFICMREGSDGLKKAVITGATSMIGVAVIRECIKYNIEVLAIVQRGSKKIGRIPDSPLIKICECNLEELHRLFGEQGAGEVAEEVAGENAAGEGYDVFYHLAWGFTGKQTRDNPVLQAQNIQYTMDAVELARRLGCQKFIGAGSQAEYGIVHEVIDSRTKAAPVSAYGISKHAAGLLTAKLCAQYQMTHIWGRIFSVYGCNDSEETMLSYAVNRFLRQEKAQFSAATQYWDYLFEEDAGKILYLLGERAQRSGCYRIASGQSRPLKEFILELRDLFPGNPECAFDKDTDTGHLVSLQVDIEDLVREIGFCPEVTFGDGIKRVIMYWKEKYQSEVDG